MSTAVQARLELDEVLSNNNSADLREDVVEDANEDNTVTINDVDSIKRAIIKTSKNEAQAPYTILLVGETGVGKSSVLEFIANVFAGNDIDNYNFDILDHADELGGPNESKTNSAQLYEFTSKNGMVLRILDTPWLTNDRGARQDELHKKSVVDQIEKDIDSVTAVLVLANGTVPRINVGTDYALSILSTIFTRTTSKNVAFLLTNTSNPLYQNFSGDILPESVKGAPQFLINNPIALQRKYLELKGSQKMRAQMTSFREAVKASEQDALEMLVDLFDWLDGLEP